MNNQIKEAAALALSGQGVAVIMGDLRTSDIVTRLMASVCDVDVYKLRTRRLSQLERESVRVRFAEWCNNVKTAGGEFAIAPNEETAKLRWPSATVFAM